MSRLNDILNGKGENYILPFFWQHGEDEETLRHYMNVIHNANIGAVCVESRPHPDFVGPKWWQDMDVILDEAKKLNMKVWILDDEHFPTGYAAGAIKKAPVELHHQYLDYHRLDVCGPQPQTQIVMENYIHPDTIPKKMMSDQAAYTPVNDDQFYQVIACPVIKKGKLGEPLNLTHLVKDGVLTWDVPEGYFLIFVLYLTRDADGRNDYINFIDKESCKVLIDTVYEPHWEHYKEEFGKTIAGFFSDEPPIGNTPFYTNYDKIGKVRQPLPWSDYVPERMKQVFGGENWINYLPYLWMEAYDEQMKARIRTVYMDVISQLVQKCFSEQVGQWCEKHGIEYIGHIMEGESSRLGPNLVHFYRAMKGQHMSGIDNIGNCVMIGGQENMRCYEEGWSGETTLWHYGLGKLGAGQAAVDPKKKGRCMCENFGAYGWGTGVKSFKYFMDFFLVRGVNYYVPHAFSPKAFPDPDCPPHFYAHGENPQYKAFGELMAYTNRVCHLITEGKSHPVAALLYHGEEDWAGSFENNGIAAKALTTAQIDFHIIPADVYKDQEAYRTQIGNGKWSVNGHEYQALIISGGEYLYREAAKLAAALLKEQIPVYITGEYPKGISNCTKEESEALIKELIGMMHTDAAELADRIRATVDCDVTLAAPYPNLTYYHYTTDNDAYFFLNEDPVKTFAGEVTVRTNGTPYLYDAWTNRVYPVVYENFGDVTKLHLRIQPLDMVIITFDAGLKEAVEPMPKENGRAIVIDQFDISLAEAKAYPEFTPTELHDSKQSVALAYPDFSGWIRYEAEFTVENMVENAVLKIDNVFEAAEVYVNDICVGTRVAKPYSFDIGKAVKSGKNTLRIDVATTLQRKMWKLEKESSFCKASPLSPTGIVGKVTIYT